MWSLAFASLAVSMGATPQEADVMWHWFKGDSVHLKPSHSIQRCAELLTLVRSTPIEVQEEQIRQEVAARASEKAQLESEAATLAKFAKQKRSKLSRYFFG